MTENNLLADEKSTSKKGACVYIIFIFKIYENLLLCLKNLLIKVLSRAAILTAVAELERKRCV